MRKIILLAVAILSAIATGSAQEHEKAMPRDGALLVMPDALLWLAPSITCLESTPLERCPPSPAVVPFADEQRMYDLQELCGHVFYERLALHIPSPTGAAHERTVVLEDIRVVWAGDPAASVCSLLDTGTEALYLLVDDLSGSSPPRPLAFPPPRPQPPPDWSF